MKYLDALDAMLHAGVGQISPVILERQVVFVASKQRPDGGFSGRLGGSDLYYTDFALRVLSLLSPQHDALEHVGDWLMEQQTYPQNAIQCFSLLNAERLVNACDIHVQIDEHHLLQVIENQQIPTGGFARPGSGEISAYNSFLAALCCEMLEIDFPHPAQTADALCELRSPDGGYRESPDHSTSQTNATSAAIACLTMLGRMGTEDIESASDFLASMQSPDGGILAQPSAPEADLLSTFTGIVTLFGLNALDRLDLPSAARYIGGLACPEGGFKACPSDDEPDIEYTYYGIAALALLRVYVLAKESDESG